MSTGRIFAIEEFSTYDGPGIRMTVFLKGCPLRCEWCHSPEGQDFDKQMVKSPNGCIVCGRCTERGRALTGYPCLVPESASACPMGLVRVCGEDVTAEELCGKIMKNSQILAISGGGVTFSGGEALCQPEFVCECLDMLEGKLHRAIQTCGYCDGDVFRHVIDKSDLVLYDLKLIDSEVHRSYTGVPNERIIENYATLVRSGTPIITRIPLIPTVTDTEKNLRGIAELMSSLGVSYAELLPYNKLAGAKYALVGREYEPSFDGSRAVETREEIFREYGIEVRVL